MTAASASPFRSTFYRTLLDASPSPIMVVGENLRMVDFNEAASRMFLEEKRAVIGQRAGSALACVHSNDAHGGCGKSPYCLSCVIRNSMNKSLKGEKIVQQTAGMEFMTGTKTVRTIFSLTAVPLKYRQQRLVMMTLEDITERVRTEEAHQRMESQLRQAQKMESIGHLAAGIAHEINTPTQYIRNNVLFLKIAFQEFHQLLENQNQFFEKMSLQKPLFKQAAKIEYLVKEIPSAIQHSLDGIDNVAKIVRSVREFSHPGSKKKTLADLNNAVDGALTVSSNEWKAVAEVVTQFDPKLPLVPCLPDEISQTVLNIVVNAAHAIADFNENPGVNKGTITVSTKQDGDWAEIRISDTGAGIPAFARDHIFNPFFTTKRVGKGTGLGLAIAHNIIVDQHNGTITFETSPDHGTTFIIRLPLTPLMKTRILFIDDDPKVLESMQRVLFLMNDEWDMYFVGSGQEALALMAENPFDIIISDMIMPGMNGAELLTEVMNRYPATVRFILSGYAPGEDIFKCIASTDQFFSKPVDITALKSAVESSLRELHQKVKSERKNGILGAEPIDPLQPSSIGQLPK